MYKKQKTFSSIVLITFFLIGMARLCEAQTIARGGTTLNTLADVPYKMEAQTTVGEDTIPSKPALDAARVSSPPSPLPDSVNAALDTERSAIARLREKTEYQHRLTEIACYKNFFVNACLEKEQKQFVQDMDGLRRREINNNQKQRDYDASQRVASQAKEEAKRQAERPKEEMRKAENRAAYERKVKAIEQRQAEMHSAQSQRERENNVRAFNEKQQEVQRHREALEARKAENKRRFNEAQQQTEPAKK